MPTNDEPLALKIATQERDGVVVVALSGELDLAACDGVIAALDGAAARSPQCLIVDLGQLHYMDSSGIHALLHAKNRADEQGHRLAIVRSPAVERVFELTKVESMFELVDDPAELGLTPAEENEREERGNL
jgi:anti-sigma B factor antagonist